MKKIFLLLSFVFLPALAQAAGDSLGLFPFFARGDNLPEVWVNPSQQVEAGANGQVTVDGDRFVTAENGQEIRFWGVNTCFSMNFSAKEDAVNYARRMANFGVNAVRLHHMDNYNIWGPNAWKDVSKIDPEQLDKLDWLIYQFKKNGIYVNINLHVSRELNDRNGFSPSSESPGYNKGLDNFEPRMIEFQKQYARDLLTHVNPYTKMAYTDDPCVAMIEINNENSVVASWFWGELDKLGPTYEAEYQKLWNDWLRKKYKSTAEVRKAWNCRFFPIEESIIPDSGFDDPEGFKNSKWYLENGQGESTLEVKDGVLRLEVKKLGTVSWNPQFYFCNFPVTAGKPYTLKFRVRTDVQGTSTLNSGCSQSHENWENLGLFVNYKVTNEWNEYTYTFVPTSDDPNARISFNGFSPGVYEFDDISLVPGGNIGIAESEKLEDGTIRPMYRTKEVGRSTPESIADFTNFVIDLETKYWNEMRRFIKEDLHAKAPVTGTQLQYGAHYAQGRMDYCDIHAYWNHPSFPGRPWDGGNWKLGNTSIANALGKNSTVESLANLRVLGKPYTVSEYNHPYPNLYGAEGFPVLSSVAAFQNWSGIFIFAWSHSDKFGEQETPSFFDIKGNSVQLVHMAACYNMFVRGDVADANSVENAKKVVYALGEQQEREIQSKASNGYHRSLRPIGLWAPNALLTSVGVRLTDLKIPEKATKGVKPVNGDDASSVVKEMPNHTVSNTGQLIWNAEVENRGFYQVDSPRTKVFTGFIQGRTFEFKNGRTLKIEFGQTILDWATVSLTRTKKNHYLLAATGLQKNSDCVLGLYDPNEVKDTPVDEYPNLINKQITFCKQPGHAPLMCEGIPAKLTLEVPAGKTVKFYPLDENANRKDAVEAQMLDATHAVIEISSKYKTLWYEIVLEP
ncbi:MAG: carbohydrate binding domain-containing protein [Thermoguttaceae bacterium]|nr:carbohydrate binding domain-containing protein [Thermoguttaceae bacterium]